MGEGAKWLKRAKIKQAWLDNRLRLAWCRFWNIPIGAPSGSWLNKKAGLPADAEWREENFA